MVRFFLRVTILGALLPGIAFAATHEVQVGNSFFSPNDLTINVGDTVRWSYSGNLLHDVTADDFSWGSPTATAFTFERTFNTAGEVLYHCTVHSSPGRNINTFMNGRLNVVEANGSGVDINVGMSDAWLNPSTPGQGFFIIAWEDIQTMFLSWFTFDTELPAEGVDAVVGDPGHRWLTAQGPFSGDTAVLDVFLTTGGVFDSPTPEPNTDPQPIGTISITWSSCAEGLLSYELAGLGLTGEMPIVRIVSDNEALCEAAQPAR